MKQGVFSCSTFFELPVDDLSRYYSSDDKRKCMLYTSIVDYDNEELHHWRDAISLKCTPLEECVPSWAEKLPSSGDHLYL